MDITGDYTQVGTTNSQNINSHNNFHFHFHMNCTECRQHHPHEGVAFPGGDIHQAIECLQKMVASGGQGTQITAGSGGQGTQLMAASGGQGTQLMAASGCQGTQLMAASGGQGTQITTASGGQGTQISAGAGDQGTQITAGPGGQGTQLSAASGGQGTQISDGSGGQAPQITTAAATIPESEAVGYSSVNPVTTTRAAVTDSVRIFGSCGQVLKPGDLVFTTGVYGLYVGDGYIVYLNEDSRIVVKEKIDLTKPFRNFFYLKLRLFTRQLRVQRALEHVGRPYPVPEESPADFIYWTCTGFSLKDGHA